MSSSTQVWVALAITGIIAISILVVTVKDYRQRRKLVERALEDLNKPKLKV